MIFLLFLWLLLVFNRHLACYCVLKRSSCMFQVFHVILAYFSPKEDWLFSCGSFSCFSYFINIRHYLLYTLTTFFRFVMNNDTKHELIASFYFFFIGVLNPPSIVQYKENAQCYISPTVHRVQAQSPDKTGILRKIKYEILFYRQTIIVHKCALGGLHEAALLTFLPLGEYA